MDQESVEPNKAGHEKRSFFQKVMRALAYPVSGISGLWMMERDLHDSAYYNLKRYGAFKDILDKLGPMNEKNVDGRVKNIIPLEAFEDMSRYTRTEYSKQVTERMAHMGFTDDLAGFVKKWNYVNRGGKREAVIKGLTVAGIAIGATLAMSNSVFKDTDEKTR